MENGFELRINRLDTHRANGGIRHRQRRALTQLQRYRVGEMADTAVVVFVRLRMPVPGSLEGKRHHQHGHQRGQDPASDMAPCLQLDTPTEDGN